MGSDPTYRAKRNRPGKTQAGIVVKRLTPKLNFCDVRRLQAFGALLNFELYTVALIQ